MRCDHICLPRTVLVAVTIALALCVSGCSLLGGGVTPAEPPDGPAGILGSITRIDRVDDPEVWGTVLVEGGEQPQGAVSDKASVRITTETLIARAERWIPADELAVGMTVRVWFDGPVAESYPVQGSAAFIEVDE